MSDLHVVISNMNNAMNNKYGTARYSRIRHQKPDNAGSNVQQENSQLPLISHKALQPSDKRHGENVSIYR